MRIFDYLKVYLRRICWFSETHGSSSPRADDPKGMTKIKLLIFLYLLTKRVFNHVSSTNPVKGFSFHPSKTISFFKDPTAPPWKRLPVDAIFRWKPRSFSKQSCPPNSRQTMVGRAPISGGFKNLTNKRLNALRCRDSQGLVRRSGVGVAGLVVCGRSNGPPGT